MSITTAFSYLLWSLLTASQISPRESQLRTIFELEVDHEPELNTVAEARPGEPLYSEFGYPVLQIAKLSEEAKVNGKVWPKGKILHGAMLGDSEVFCDPASLRSMSSLGLTAAHSMMLQRFDEYICLLNDDRDLDFDVVIDKANPQPDRFTEIPYELGTIKADNVGLAAKTFRRMLFIESYSSGVLRLQYTDAVEDSGAPAMARSLAFDLHHEYPQEISFKEVRVEVLEANSNSIRYQVLHGFHR